VVFALLRRLKAARQGFAHKSLPGISSMKRSLRRFFTYNRKTPPFQSKRRLYRTELFLFAAANAEKIN
jgi:hypothetical protein